MQTNGALLCQAGQAVMQAQFDAEGLAEPDRVAPVVAAIKGIETEGVAA